MTQTDTTVEEAIVAMTQTNPDLSVEEMASRLGCTPEEVEASMAALGSVKIDALGPEDWTDPDRCPFCGESLTSPGAGFIDHLDASEECADEFDQWREAIAGDVSGEWGG